MSNRMKCGGCTFDVNTDPCKCPIVPPEYPFNRPARDSYSFCCCGPSNPLTNKDPITQAYPSAGMFKGSAFAMYNGNPFIMDSTNMTYGQVLVYSENVYTRVSQRDDLSCINLAARFDMTDTSLTNTVRNDFLKQYISRKYLELQGVLPIIKTAYKMRIHYTIRDVDGGTINSTHVDTDITESHFHFTDIKDRYVQSVKGLVVTNIPAITYQGLYNITIDRVELIVKVIDTKEHLVDAMNPFYIFTNNNSEIQLQSATIESTPEDNTFVIAECDVLKAFDYQANITNRLRISFTAFTSIPIACGDTMGIWNALNEPTDAVISQLRNEVTALEDEVAALHAKDAEQDARIEYLEGQVALNKDNIAALTARVATLEADSTTKDGIIASIISRLEALERIPLALVSYGEGVEFKRSQLTWKAYGELYQVTRNYTASGNFIQDVGLGYLVPVIKDSSDYDAIIARVDAVEITANNASDTASTAYHATEELTPVVTGNTEAITELQTSVSTQSEQITQNTEDISQNAEGISQNTEAITALQTSVSSHSDAITANTTAIETNSGAISDLNTVVTALNEDVDDLDERVTILEHPLDNTKINVRKVSDSSVRTFNTMTDAAAYINADVAEDDEQYDLIIGPQMSHSSDTDYQKIASSKLRDVYNNGVNTTIDAEIFRDSGIEHFYWGDMSAASSISVGNMAFGGCTHLVAFDLPSPDEVSYVSLGNNVLAGCSALTSIKLDTNATTLGNTMFAGCSALKTAEIAVDVKPGMFNGSAIETVVLKPTCSEIGSGAFAATPIKTINLTQSIGDIKSQAFQGCSGLTSINIDINYDICAAAFQGCTNLSEITIGNSVRDILNQAFAYTAITTIDIPSNINTIATNAFEHTSLETINVHASEGSISGAPWGATGATVNWIGE